MTTRRRRWSPGSPAWIRTWDSGDRVIWMKPLEDGCEIAMYSGFDWEGTGPTTWIVRVPRGSWIPYEVMDKPHRIRWVSDEHNGGEYPILFGGEVLHIIHHDGTSHIGHRRTHRTSFGRTSNPRTWNWSKSRHRLYRWPLPRPIARAIKPRRNGQQ